MTAAYFVPIPKLALDVRCCRRWNGITDRPPRRRALALALAEEHMRQDDLAFARGALLALPIGIALWLFLLATALR